MSVFQLLCGEVCCLIPASNLEKEMATHSSILAWEIPWTEEPGELQFMGVQKSWTNLQTKQQEQQIRFKQLGWELFER